MKLSYVALCVVFAVVMLSISLLFIRILDARRTTRIEPLERQLVGVYRAMELFRGLNGRYPNDAELGEIPTPNWADRIQYSFDGGSYLMIFRKKGVGATTGYAVTENGTYISIHPMGPPREPIHLDASWINLEKFDNSGMLAPTSGPTTQNLFR